MMTTMVDVSWKVVYAKTFFKMVASHVKNVCLFLFKVQ